MKKYVLAFLLILGVLPLAHAERRLALIVGNSDYGKANYLPNPVNDAEDVSSKMAMMGFEVLKLTDASLRGMSEAISDFSQKSSQYDVVLFYYSGHGLQMKGENYLMPVDAEPKSEADVRWTCFPLNQLLDNLEESSCPMKIIVLDACRNNPFTKRWYRGDKAQGLASVNPPKGTYMSFSTAAGSVALDGTGRNSPFTKSFLETLDVPNLSLFDFFNEVGQKVLAATNNEQDPWMNHNTMVGKFYFNTSTITRHSVKRGEISTLPEWVKTKGPKEYVGVSVPIEDKDKARRLAIVNAALQYMFFEGGVKTGLFGELKTKNLQTKVTSDVVMSEEKQSLEAVGLNYFSIEVKKEFVNNNNELFVLCSFERRDRKHTKNGILVSRKMQVDRQGKSAYAALSVDATIDAKDLRVGYDYYKSPVTGARHRLLLDSVEVASQALAYSDNVLSPTDGIRSFPLIDISECGSLCVAELALLAQFPVATENVSTIGLADFEENGETSFSKASYAFKGNGVSKPINTEIVQIKDRQLCVSIKDPYDMFYADYHISKPVRHEAATEEGVPVDFADLAEMDSVDVQFTPCEESPILLERAINMFQSLCMLLDRGGVRTKGNIGESGLQFSANTSYTFSQYYPFFFLDGQRGNDTPYCKNMAVVAPKISTIEADIE